MSGNEWIIPDVSEGQIVGHLNYSKRLFEAALGSERNSHHLDLIKEMSSRGSEKKPNVWVLSTGRCGTYALHKLLQSSARVASYHRRGRPLFNRNEIFYGFCFGLCHEEWLENACFDYLTDQTVGELISSQLRDRQFVSLDNHQVAWLPIILSAFPNDTFIHLIRDPRDEISSWAKNNIYSQEQISAVKINGFNKFGEYRSFQSQPADIDLLTQLAWHWRIINLYIEQSLSIFSGRRIVIKSEDLYRADESVYKSIAETCELDGMAYEDFDAHFKVKHNAMAANGPYAGMSRDSFQKGWTDNLGAGYKDIMMRYGYDAL